jgi:16S rRNA (adenine(1408)-N(1))-methyltransferase
METIRGRRSLELDINGFKNQSAGYARIIVDLGTGDGRYVKYTAENDPRSFVIGLDACRENLHEHSRAKLQNMLFIIASAQEIPCELNGLASQITINFPWGSLLESVLTGDERLMTGLAVLSRSTTSFEIRLNEGALVEAGRTLETGVKQIYNNLVRVGWEAESPMAMNTAALRAFPSTWARRLAFGPNPRAMALSGRLFRSP